MISTSTTSKSCTFGEKLSDLIAKFGGSWYFIITFAIILTVWITFNTYLKLTAFDPYPFILLNLLLSCIAALQAPFILMSQNRQEIRDRARDRADHAINKKAEQEVREILEIVKKLQKQ